jgi:FAD/FMN-containing dehydrogenase
MSTVALKAQIVPRTFRTYSNKHQTFSTGIRRFFDIWNPLGGSATAQYNATGTAIQELMAECLARGLRLRALGGGWSFSPVAATDGWLLNTKPLNLLFRFEAGDIAAGYTGDAAGLRFAQCGVSVKELDDRLRADGRSLRTHGASNGQTIAGAISTGTHGSAIDIGAMTEAVVGLHVVMGPGRSVWLERASRPVASDMFLARFGVTEVHRNDALFNAALVSFGSFGVILGVALETDPLFLIDYERKLVPFDAALEDALRTLTFDGLGLPARPYHFEVVVNPFAVAQGVFRSTGFRRPYAEPYVRPPFGHDGIGPGDDALAFIGMITDARPHEIVPLVGSLMSQVYTPKATTGTLGEIYTNSTTRGKAGSTAIGIPTEHAPDALNLLLDIIDSEGPFAAIPALRFIRGDAATLGWARFPLTCVIEADGPFSKRNTKLYELFWDALEAFGIPHAFHWGKIFPADAARIARCYGPALHAWIAARHQLLPDAAVRHMFSSELLEQIGLADEPGEPLRV